MSVSILFTGDLMPFGSYTTPLGRIEEFVNRCNRLRGIQLRRCSHLQETILAPTHHSTRLLTYLQSRFSNKIILNVANNHSADFGHQVFQRQNATYWEIRDFQLLEIPSSHWPSKALLTICNDITFVQDPILDISDKSDFCSNSNDFITTLI